MRLGRDVWESGIIFLACHCIRSHWHFELEMKKDEGKRRREDEEEEDEEKDDA